MASTASTNGSTRPVVNDTPSKMSRLDHEILQLNIDLKNSKGEKAYTKKTYTGFHGDVLIGVSMICIMLYLANVDCRINLRPRASSQT